MMQISKQQASHGRTHTKKGSRVLIRFIQIKKIIVLYHTSYWFCVHQHTCTSAAILLLRRLKRWMSLLSILLSPKGFDWLKCRRKCIVKKSSSRFNGKSFMP